MDPQALEGLKFFDCLPPEIALRAAALRARDMAGVRQVLDGELRVIAE